MPPFSRHIVFGKHTSFLQRLKGGGYKTDGGGGARNFTPTKKRGHKKSYEVVLTQELGSLSYTEGGRKIVLPCLELGGGGGGGAWVQKVPDL